MSVTYREADADMVRPAGSKLRALGVLTVTALSACGGGDAGNDAERRRDQPRMGTVTLRTAGGPDGTFGRVGGLAQDVGGRIYVADMERSVIAVYGPTGVQIARMGRRGSGPGELAAPCCLTFGPDGALWLRDHVNDRLLGFSMEAIDQVTLAREIETPMALSKPFGPIDFRGDSVVYTIDRVGPGVGGLVRRVFHPHDGGRARVQVIRHPPVDSLGGLTVSVRDESGRTHSRHFMPPFPPRFLVGWGPDGTWAEATSDRYEVRLLRPGGDTVRIRRQIQGPGLTAAELSRASERLELDRRLAGPWADSLPYGVPERKPPLSALYFDADGRLWVELTSAPGQPRRADLYDREGTLLERRAWPAEVDLSTAGWRGRDVALGVVGAGGEAPEVARVEW